MHKKLNSYHGHSEIEDLIYIKRICFGTFASRSISRSICARLTTNGSKYGIPGDGKSETLTNFNSITGFTLEFPDLAMEDSYAIQLEWVQLKLNDGRRVSGHKIGLTSRAMQRSSNITEPDYGVLLDDMMLPAGTDIPISRFIFPRVEVELAFILKQGLSGPNCTIYDVLNATDYIVPAIEIIDARIQQIDQETRATRKIQDNIADNVGNAAGIVGGRPFKPDALDIRWVSALLFRNGVIEESGVAAAVLNHPANGPAWLANKLHPHNVSLLPGQIILGGSFRHYQLRIVDDV